MIPCSSNTPLTTRQKAILCQLARSAWRRLPEPRPVFEEWRHAEQEHASRKTSLCFCTQEDFNSIKAHYQDLIGRADMALNTLLRDSTNDARVARFKLEESCRDRGVSLSYAVAICRRQFRCELDQASAKQIWCLNFTIRSRRKPLQKPFATTRRAA